MNKLPSPHPTFQQHGAGRLTNNSTHRLEFSSADTVLFFLGCISNLFANQAIQPIVAAFIFYIAGLGSLFLPRFGGHHERRIYTRVFAVGFVMAGISSVYRIVLGDMQGDALNFYEVSSNVMVSLTLVDLQAMFENALPILLWGFVYDFFDALGFPREQYIGILFNVLVVAITGVIALKMTRQVYGFDFYRFKRLTLLFSACGLFWVFAGIHLRDSMVLLAVTALTYSWLYFLSKPDLGVRLLQLIGFSLLASLFFGFLRTEFMFVPIALVIAGVAALMVGLKKGRRIVAYLVVLVGLAVSAWLVVYFGEDIQLMLVSGNENYNKMSLIESADESLAMALIVTQPVPIRLFLGSIYLFVFPIPFWSGFQLESAYQLFKSFNVVFFYFVIPLLVMTVLQLVKDKTQHSSMLVFLLFVSLGVTVVIAGSSLETRHHGAFFASIFVLALLPDLRARTVWQNYKQLSMVMLTGVAVVHLYWLYNAKH